MKLARFQVDDKALTGVVDEGTSLIHVIRHSMNGFDPVISIIKKLTDGTEIETNGETYCVDDVSFLSPITQPSKNIICIGKNYAAHAREVETSGFDSIAKDKQSEIPEHPIVFTKAPSTLTGSGHDINVPWQITSKVDYEAELGVVIGKGGRSIAKQDAYQHVWGYTVINDVSARDVQNNHKQWFLGKSIDSFCPMGPWIVSADEVDPESLEVSCWVNGELRQNAPTKNMIFDIPTIIATISASMTLCTGDVIATGTPEGVGMGFDPPKFLKSGDVVRISIPGIGSIENTIR